MPCSMISGGVRGLNASKSPPPRLSLTANTNSAPAKAAITTATAPSTGSLGARKVHTRMLPSAPKYGREAEERRAHRLRLTAVEMIVGSGRNRHDEKKVQSQCNARHEYLLRCPPRHERRFSGAGVSGGRGRGGCNCRGCKRAVCYAGIRTAGPSKPDDVSLSRVRGALRFPRAARGL